MRVAVLILLWLSLTVTVLGQQQTTTGPDEIFYNGKVITVDSAFSIKEAFAIKEDRFLAVGSNAQILPLAGPTSRRVDLHGSTVIPGLIDDHNHQYNAAFMLLQGVNLVGVPTLAEMLSRIRQAVAISPQKQTVVGTAGWNEGTFPEKRPPTRQDLDQISLDHPILVFRARGNAYLNTAALAAAAITRQTESVSGFAIPKDSTGEPTGTVTGPGAVLEVADRVIAPLSEEQKEDLILRMQQEQHAVGLTSIREPELPPDIMRVYWRLWREGKLTMRVSMGLDVPPEDAVKMEEILQPWGVGPGFGDHILRLDAIGEFLVDVNLPAHTAYLREPYIDLPGNNVGAPRITPVNFRQAVLVINRYGWRPAIHIYGDKALDIVLDGYQSADNQKSIRESRWIVEHVPLVHPDQMEEMARLGVMIIANVQPYSGAEGMIRSLGKERAEGTVPMRQLLDHHLTVGTGTDWPTFTDNPFLSMYFYITRKTADGKVSGASQKITREEALRVATINNAYITYEEGVKGSIEAGKLADFLVLSQDLLAMPEDEIRSIHPLATYVGGREVFSDGHGF